MKFDTKVLHGYPVIDPVTGASSIPKYQASTFSQGNFPKNNEFSYTRFGNPTIQAAEKAIASLENAKYGLAFSSGMAAITTALFLAKSGDHIVLGKNIYGGTFQLLTEMLSKFNVTYTFVDETEPSKWEGALQSNTSIFYLESPSNPLLTITDIKKVCEIAQKNEITTICDNTFMTPYIQNPLELGVDIVVHSATKFLGGHSDIVMGLIATNSLKLYELLYSHQKMLGAIPGIEESWLMLRGLKTLTVRMEKACQNASFLAKKLSEISDVEEVYYPGLVKNQQSMIHEKQAVNGGAVLSFKLKSEDKVNSFFEKLTIPIVAVSLGGVESIVSYPWTMSHACMSEDDRRKAGVTPTLIRLSCGIENADDIFEDILNALEEK